MLQITLLIFLQIMYCIKSSERKRELFQQTIKFIVHLLLHQATADLTMFGPANLFNFQMLWGLTCSLDSSALGVLPAKAVYIPLTCFQWSILGLRGFSGKKNIITTLENLFLDSCFILVVLMLNGTVDSFLPFPNPYKLIANHVLQHQSFKKVLNI